MMSLYDRTIPVFSHGLTALSGLLGKAEAHCEAHRIDPAVVLTDRLFPDMLPFTRQVQIATDHARRCPARLAGIDPVAMEDTETTFAALQDRIGRTKEVLSTFERAAIDAGTDREISFKAGGRDVSFSGANYVSFFALPNFYFHMSIAHAILRQDGVAVGKTDFLGG
jgi:uncharacterized protein